nr:class I SAM-dependent methyltransferase [Streptomyces boncukensis]
MAEELATPRTEALSALVAGVLTHWPEHEGFLAARFAGETADQLRACEAVARRVRAVVSARMREAVEAYRWLCTTFLAEEAYFRAHGRYRHSTFAEVEAAGCLTVPYMRRYMTGLLVTQALWTNHTRVLDVYAREFLGRRGARDSLLEVGPGHGLLLSLAAGYGVRRLAGWDISAASLELTREGLTALGVGADRVDLVRADINEAAAGSFDLVVASELLEHVEEPAPVLRSLLTLLAPGGRIFLNVPVNSPAPDHITLWRSPEEFFGFAESCGVAPLRTHVFPLTGSTVARARRNAYTLSCVVVGAAA